MSRPGSNDVKEKGRRKNAMCASRKRMALQFGQTKPLGNRGGSFGSLHRGHGMPGSPQAQAFE
jgi:hypothetical protein